jgi:hypothetical protein
MAAPLVRSLDRAPIDMSREFVGFRFPDAESAGPAIQIDLAYAESLFGLVSPSYVSWVAKARYSANRLRGYDYVSVPRVDIEYQISVAGDLITDPAIGRSTD